MSSRWRFILKIIRNSTQRKHLLAWMKSSLQEDYLLRQKQPWLPFDVIDVLNFMDLDSKRVFEYGSGGSTLYWLDAGALCVSIEHDPSWFEIVKQHINFSLQIDYRLVSPELRTQAEKIFDPANPDVYISDDESFRDYTFQNYASQIDEFPDEHFDLILIDGRARASCIKHSVTKIKVGGMIIVDNADRNYYFTQTSHYLDNFTKREFLGIGPLNQYLWKTDIYIRAR